MLVEEDIKAKDLKAHIVGIILRLAGAIMMGKERLSRYQSLRYAILDPMPNFPVIMAQRSDFSQCSRQGSLVPLIHFIFVLIELEFVTVFVNGVICQVHEKIVQVVFLGNDIGYDNFIWYVQSQI